MRLRLAVAVAVAVVAAALSFAAPPQAATPRPKSLTIAFAATGGTQHDTVKAVMKQSPTCTVRFEGTQDSRDLAWKVKWSHIKLPKGSKIATAELPVTVTGTTTTDLTLRHDTGCTDTPPPPQHCEGPIAFEATATVRIRRTAKGYSVVAGMPHSDESEGIVQAEEAQASEGCEPVLRTPAFHAEVSLPRKAGRAVVIPVDSSANEARAVETRPRIEDHYSDDEGSLDLTSEVAWSGIVTSRFNRR